MLVERVYLGTLGTNILRNKCVDLCIAMRLQLSASRA